MASASASERVDKITTSTQQTSLNSLNQSNREHHVEPDESLLLFIARSPYQSSGCEALCTPLSSHRVIGTAGTASLDDDDRTNGRVHLGIPGVNGTYPLWGLKQTSPARSTPALSPAGYSTAPAVLTASSKLPPTGGGGGAASFSALPWPPRSGLCMAERWPPNPRGQRSAAAVESRLSRPFLQQLISCVVQWNARFS